MGVGVADGLAANAIKLSAPTHKQIKSRVLTFVPGVVGVGMQLTPIRFSITTSSYIGLGPFFWVILNNHNI